LNIDLIGSLHKRNAHRKDAGLYVGAHSLNHHRNRIAVYVGDSPAHSYLTAFHDPHDREVDDYGRRYIRRRRVAVTIAVAIAATTAAGASSSVAAGAATAGSAGAASSRAAIASVGVRSGVEQDGIEALAAVKDLSGLARTKWLAAIADLARSARASPLAASKHREKN
jgi:hypothetical protein